ncbi:MAG: HlyD family efflux transporter periplasmic adaptor subunit [Oscillospiraceae bacterium]|nr:HlyD family efflux transporter periplasmic adaptor subunit [Oscillospiraceae bacterium]
MEKDFETIGSTPTPETLNVNDDNKSEEQISADDGVIAESEGTAKKPSALARAGHVFGAPLRWFKRGSKKRKVLTIIVLVIVLFVIVSALRGCSAAKNASASTYTEEPVATRSITQSLSGSGTLEPADSYTVTTLVKGEVTSADFEEGDTVEKDTVLYQIDSSDISGGLEKAQLSLDQAQRSYEDALDIETVDAPIAGKVYSLNVSVGDQVTAGETIGVILNSSTMSIKVPFPADDAAKFYVGEAATVTLDSSFETISGKVTAVSGSNTVLTGNMIVRYVTVQVTNPGALTDSQSATVSINGGGCAASATFSYKGKSDLTATASGSVTAINASEGASVSKDQTVVTLGGDSIENQVQSAYENLRNAQLSYDNASDTLDNYTIKSPIAGTIVDKQYKIGDSIEAGKTLCTIYDLSYLEVTLNIDELDISNVSVGQTVQITADAVDGTYEGVITKVSVAGTTTNGTTTYPVTVKLTNTGDLLPGMNVDAVIVIAEANDVLAIPSAAVERGNLVLITSASPSASNAVQEQNAPEGYVYVNIETGVSDDDYIEVKSGLQKGDTVAYIKAMASDTNSLQTMMMDEGGEETTVSSDQGAPSGGGGPSGGGTRSGGGPQG